MNELYYIFLVLYVACLTTRTVYEMLKKAGRVDLKNKSLFWVIFTVMCVMWVSWFSLCPLDPWAVGLPVIIQLMGLGLFLLGLVLAFGALIQLKGLEDIDHLVTRGLFSRLRHPMYTGFKLWTIGWAVYYGALVSLVFGLIGIANFFYWRQLEDTAMEARYGDVYREYRRVTWF